jgi:D-tyrosyl-tRNA(Tyr) deacylase
MKAVVQRVSSASVSVKGLTIAKIQAGMLILLGVHSDDQVSDLEWLAGKVSRLRIFSDQHSLMNSTVQDVGGDIIVVSQFTLYASTKKGNRPSYISAAKPELAIPMYEEFIEKLKVESGVKVYKGEFGADMQVSLINDGPVTIVIDSKNKD